MLGHTELDEEQARFVSQIGIAGRSLAGVINDVLDLSKIEAGEMSLHESTFSLSALIDELISVMTVQAAAKQVELLVRIDPSTPDALFGDAVHLRHILVNLLSNAVKFTEQGNVSLEVRTLQPLLQVDEVSLCFVIRDTGIGISDDVQARLFMPFVQADASTTRRYGGTGLGLSIVKRLATLMHGEVTLASVPGRGSEFTVVVPLHLAMQPLHHPQPAAAAFQLFEQAGLRAPQYRDSMLSSRSLGSALSHPRVARLLVVDDSATNRELVKRMLEGEGAVVTTADNGLQALQCLEQDPSAFDAVLMDVQMPVLDGLEATRRIRESLQLRSLPIVALSAGAFSNERQRAIDAGMDGFISKPFDPPALFRTLTQFLAQAAPDLTSLRVALQTTESRHDAVGALNASDPHFMSEIRRLLCDEFADLEAEATALDQDALAKRLHRLAGSAGMIGETALAEAAEAALLATQSQYGDALSCVIERVTPLLEELRLSCALSIDTMPVVAAPQVDSAPDGQLDRLMKLLEERHISALDAFQEIRAELSRSCGANTVQQIALAIERLQYDTAIALINEARGAAFGRVSSSMI